MYDVLFQPIKIGTVELKNRFVMPAMDSSTTTPQHRFSKQSIDYFAARAKGGFSLIISEFMAVKDNGFATSNQVGIYDDSFIENLKSLTDEIHKYNAKCAAQLHHAGHQTNCVDHIYSVSSIPSLKFMNQVHVMTTHEIYELIQCYVDAAYRAKMAGFDMVEVHGAHGYLIGQFFSNNSNKRTDEFGGSYENRGRFACEVIKGIKQKCGKDYPVILRISADEFIRDGSRIEDACIYSMMAEEAGADAIHVSTGSPPGGHIVTTLYQKPGFNADNARKIKECVHIPVICVGRINSPAVAKKIIATHQADLVALGRQSVCDSSFPKKLLEGRIDEIFQCTGCMQRCYYAPGYDQDDKGISCMINPFSNKEERWKILPVKNKQNIDIIGGGVAGLQAGWILAKRGFHVHLYEKESQLGGQYCLAAVPPFKQDYGKTISTLQTLCQKYGVTIHLNHEVKSEINSDSKIIIVATGSQPFIPSIEGMDTLPYCQANEILKGRMIKNKKILMVGGGIVGCETAEYLQQFHNQVDIIDIQSEFAYGMNKYPRKILLETLQQHGTHFYPSLHIKKISSEGIIAQNDAFEEVSLGIYDEIVFATGSHSYQPFKDLHLLNKKIYFIGDCQQVSDGAKAIFDATKLAIHIEEVSYDK